MFCSGGVELEKNINGCGITAMFWIVLNQEILSDLFGVVTWSLVTSVSSGIKILTWNHLKLVFKWVFGWCLDALWLEPPPIHAGMHHPCGEEFFETVFGLSWGLLKTHSSIQFCTLNIPDMSEDSGISPIESYDLVERWDLEKPSIQGGVRGGQKENEFFCFFWSGMCNADFSHSLSPF